MFKIIPFYYGSETFPETPTIDFRIDTSVWFLGIMITRFDDLMCQAKNTQIGFLCFTIRFRKFFEDMERG